MMSESSLSLCVICDCIHVHTDWDPVVDTVYKLSLSGRPVTIRLNYWSPKKGVKASNKLRHCRWESYQQQPNFHWVKREKKLNTSPTKLAPAWPQREKRVKMIDKGCSISNLSLPRNLLAVWVLPCSHVGLALQGCLCLFNYCNSGPPAECLHLPLSEVRGAKFSKKV